MTAPSFHTDVVLHQVLNERARQFAKHGDQSHLPDGTGPAAGRPWLTQQGRWLGYEHLSTGARIATEEASATTGDDTVSFADILLEEVFEALAEDDPARLRAELVQVAAVAVQWVEAIDARTGGAP